MIANGGQWWPKAWPKACAEGAPLEKKNGLFACRRRIFQGKNAIHVGRLRRAHSPQRGGRLRRSPVSTPTLTRRAPSAHPASLGGRLRRIATSRHCPSRCLRRTAAHEPRATPHACTRMQLPAATFWIVIPMLGSVCSGSWSQLRCPRGGYCIYTRVQVKMNTLQSPGQSEHPPIPRSKRTPSNPQVHPRSAGHGWDLCSALHPM